jgi:hypothetical protein
VKEKLSYVERYQAMSPRERNIEMKNIFNLLPDFDSTYKTEKSFMSLNSFEKEAECERVDELIERRVNSPLKRDLVMRLKSLLPFSHTTDFFRLDILDKLNECFGEGITRFPLIIEDKIIPSDAKNFAQVFHWDNPEDDGIFGENAKEIERRTYKDEALYALYLKQEFEEIGATQDSVEKMEIQIKEDEQFLGIARQFEDDEEIQRLEQKLEDEKEVNKLTSKFLSEIQEQGERVKRWKIEFKEFYGEEPQ